MTDQTSNPAPLSPEQLVARLDRLEARLSRTTAATIILALLLAIILRAALENFFTNLIGGRSFATLFGSWPPASETRLRMMQFFVFFVLLARFYHGASRFNEEHPPATTVPRHLLNLVGTFGLFCLFYVIAATVWTLDLFYMFIFGMHLFDAVWFFLVLLSLAPGSLLLQPVRAFLLWDVLTCLIVGFMFWGSWKGFLTGIDLSFQWNVLYLLLAMSILDWVVLADFYFRPDEWRTGVRWWRQVFSLLAARP